VPPFGDSYRRSIRGSLRGARGDRRRQGAWLDRGRFFLTLIVAPQNIDLLTDTLAGLLLAVTDLLEPRLERP
jgi:hypothetical protein